MGVALNYQSIRPKKAIFDYQTILLRSTPTYPWQVAANSSPKTLQYYDNSGALVGDAVYDVPDIARPVEKTQLLMFASAAVNMANTVGGANDVLVKANLLQWGAIDPLVSTRLDIDGVGTSPIFNQNQIIYERPSAVKSVVMSNICARYSTDLNWDLAYASFAATGNYPVIFMHLAVIVDYR